jgi:transposase
MLGQSRLRPRVARTAVRAAIVLILSQGTSLALAQRAPVSPDHPWQRALSKFIKRLRSLLKKVGSKSQDIHEILAESVSCVGREAFHGLHPQYAQGDYFSTTITQLVSYLSAFRKSMEWD